MGCTTYPGSYIIYITYIYYMDKGILLATKTLVESIRHYIRDPSGVFSVCNAREWYIDKFPPFLLLFFFKMADEFKICGVEQRRHLSLLQTIRASWQEQYLTSSLRSLVRYCSCHSNIKSISCNRLISSMYWCIGVFGVATYRKCQY